MATNFFGGGDHFKVDAPTALAMVRQWYGAVPSVKAIVTPQDEQHWINAIQKDGSHTAFRDFSNGIAKDHGPQVAQQLTAANDAQKAKTGLDLWTPATGAVNGQLPGTTQTALDDFTDFGNRNWKAGAELGAALITAGTVLPGISSVAGAAKAIPAIAAGVKGAGGLPGVSAVGSGGGSSLLDKAGNFLTGNNGLNALGIAQGVNAAQLGAKSTDYATKAADTAQQNWDANAPLRTAGRAGILNPTTPDLSQLTAIRGSNPFGKPQPVAGVPPITQTPGLPTPSPVAVR